MANVMASVYSLQLSGKARPDVSLRRRNTFLSYSGKAKGAAGDMWLNQKTVDAIRIMAALGRLYPEAAKASDLVETTGITLLNIKKTANLLAQSGLIETTRGRKGGLRIARSAERIGIGEIVRAFEPNDCPVNFLMMSEIDAAISALLFKAHRSFFSQLEATTLADIAHGKQKAERLTRG